MYSFIPKLFLRSHLHLLSLFAGACVLAMTVVALGQKEDQPAFNEFKGVQIGMRTEEARKKLGNPRDKSSETDFYMINDNQAVQVFYDKAGAVNAISIDFMSGASGIPTCKQVMGDEAQAKADGSVYKMTRYPKAGYWVSYSRTAGDSPTVTITMQKIER